MPTRRFTLVVLPLLAACGCAPAEPSPCQGFADRKLGITGAEYRPCAEKIMAALDALQPPLQAIVSDKAKGNERDDARQAFGTLRRLVRQTGVESDYRSMKPGTVITKWADSDVSAFNFATFTAMVQYMAVLAYPNRDNMSQGVRAHDQARHYYARIR